MWESPLVAVSRRVLWNPHTVCLGGDRGICLRRIDRFVPSSASHPHPPPSRPCVLRDDGMCMFVASGAVCVCMRVCACRCAQEAACHPVHSVWRSCTACACVYLHLYGGQRVGTGHVCRHGRHGWGAQDLVHLACTANDQNAVPRHKIDCTGA